LVPVVVAHLILMAEGLTRMPGGHDALKYHLPMVVGWLRADELLMRTDHWRYWRFNLPGNGELVTWWLLKGGAERLASVAYWPAGLLLAGSVWTIVRIQRGTRLAGLVAVATILSTYLVVSQMYLSYIDLFGTAFLTAGLAVMLLAIGRDRDRGMRRALFVIGGLAFGIAIGSKPVNWPYALVCSLLLFGLHVYRHAGRRDLAFLVPAFGAACALCSSFWFVRAAVETGNPFYPIDVRLDANVGEHDHSVASTSAEAVLPKLRTLHGWIGLVGEVPWLAITLDTKAGGVGALYTMILPAGALAAILMLIRGRRAGWRNEHATVLALTAAVLIVWVIPLRHYGRFGMLFLVMAVCLSAPIVGRVGRFWPVATRGAVVVAAGLSCAVVTLNPAQWLYNRIEDGAFSRAACYFLPEVIDELPAGSRLTTLTRPEAGGRGLTYPLYGEGLRNDVVEFDAIEARWPDLRPPIEGLRELGVEYVLIREPWRDDWPDRNRLELIYDDENDPNRLARRPAARMYRVPVRELAEDPAVPHITTETEEPYVSTPISRR
jgi:hypothetical protein